MFFNHNGCAYSVDRVILVDMKDFTETGILKVVVDESFVSVNQLLLRGQEALDFLMRYCPALMEGKRMKWARHAWAFHNMVAHPVLQLLHWAGFTKLGLQLHDMTVPRPRR